MGLGSYWECPECGESFRLSDKERDECRQKGMCWNCEDEFEEKAKLYGQADEDALETRDLLEGIERGGQISGEIDED